MLVVSGYLYGDYDFPCTLTFRDGIIFGDSAAVRMARSEERVAPVSLSNMIVHRPGEPLDELGAYAIFARVLTDLKVVRGEAPTIPQLPPEYIS